ncbi:hypothetical protein Tco_1201724 [Tanacetum coccineum]
MGFTLILATLDGLDVGLLEDVIGKDDCDDDDCDEEMSLVRIKVTVHQDSVMSDSDESGVTHTEISSPYEDLSDIGSPRADDHELLEPPYMLEDPYVEARLHGTTLSDYGQARRKLMQAPPSLNYVPGSEHCDDGDRCLRTSRMAEVASPLHKSPDYVPVRRLILTADPEEDEMRIPIDYPADWRDAGRR